MKRKLVKLIEVPKIYDDCELIVAQDPHIPFKTQRTYWILNANPRFSRGFHAHKYTDQILFCIKGSVKIIIDNGRERETVTLNKPNVGVMLDKMVWHEMRGFKKDTVLLILASHQYNPGDYIRNYEEFKKLTKSGAK